MARARPMPWSGAPAARYATCMRPAALLLVALLAGCGFELRGSAVLPESVGSLYVAAPEDLREEVAVYLQGSDTRLVDTRGDAAVTLTLSNPRYDRRVLSVDPTTGKEREFELSYTIDVAATAADGRVLLPLQPVGLVRDFIFDRDAIIGSSREESVLYIEMRREAVQQALRRLRAATS